MTVGQRIAKCRKNKNISQEQLAEMLEVSRQTVSKWETDAATPDTGNMMWLARILEVSVEYLACGGEAPPRKSPSANVKKSEPIKDGADEMDEEDDEEERERRDNRKFWGFVLLVLGVTAFVRFFNPDIGDLPLTSEFLGLKIIEAAILSIPVIFGLKLMLDKK